MGSTFESRLSAYAEVINRVGLNLGRHQRLLITEPYELQGVPRSAVKLVEAIQAQTRSTVEVIWGDAERLRNFALQQDWRGLRHLVAQNAVRMDDCIQRGDALLFLHGTQPDLMAGVPLPSVAQLREIGWEYFGPIAEQLTEGATNWTVAPVPSTPWADLVFGDLADDSRLPALWELVFEACRVDEFAPLQAWATHLEKLEKERASLNARRLTGLHYRGAGTDLRVALPAQHAWCTAQLSTQSGRSFVANLPTEELFTAPLPLSAEGLVRVSRPMLYGSSIIAGIELEFRRGRVVQARAKQGEALLHELLATDAGAAQLGEVALVPAKTSLARSGRFFHNPMLDENASAHIGLGNAYPFCLRPSAYEELNRSVIHVDLALDAEVILLGLEPR